MNKKTKIVALGLIIILGIQATQIEMLNYPEYFPNPTYDFSENELNADKILLGRALFYDPILSLDNSISCASCHSPYNSFAHTDHDLSHGIGDSIGLRNAPALINLAWSKNFMWDGAVRNLDMQALAPIEHPREMGSSISEAINRIKTSDLYTGMFYNAFGDSVVTGQHTLKALSAFQLSLISAGSKYDDVKNKKDTFTIQENNGYTLFKENCNSCHTEPLFTNGEFANNGLLVDTTLNDFGRFVITQIPQDSFQFKIPTLRNLEYSYPYMHDGRFRHLSEVLNHYNQEITYNTHLSEGLKEPLNLNSRDKVDLLTFLLTLSDKEFVFNPNHRFPKEIFLQTRE